MSTDAGSAAPRADAEPPAEAEPACEPRDEVCDAARVDEDCDGMANEGCACTNGATQPCGRAEGVCKPGQQRCEGGQWSSACVGAVGKPEEACECVSGTKEACGGACAAARSCDAGKWGACQPTESASAEVCDNLDNDCDGLIDDGAARCANAAEVCVEGRCVECADDAACQSLTSGCNVGVCVANACALEKRAASSACTAGAVSGVCANDECVLARGYKVEDTDIGRGERQVEFLSGDWAVAGAVHYAQEPGAYFLVHFAGSKATIYGGRNTDRGITEYAVCNADGSDCQKEERVDNYAASLEEYQPLWASPTLPLGVYTVRGRATGSRNPAAVGSIVDLDYVEVE